MRRPSARARHWARRILLGMSGLLLVAIATVWAFGGGWADRYANKRLDPGPYQVTPADLASYLRHPKVDLHADALLWRRDLSQRLDRGHVDLQRLLEADVTIQVFGIVTQVPVRKNYESNPANSDGVGFLAWVNHWPVRAWSSLKQRALVQAEALGDLAGRSDGALMVVRQRSDLEEVLRRRAAGDKVVGGLLGIEGLHALEHDLSAVNEFFDAGVRMGGLTHFFDNDLAGSLSGEAKGGLTRFGRQVVARMEELGMIVDLAHASPAAVADTLAMATRPVVVSHTGVTGTCPGNRNLTDDQIRSVADNGGVIGIGYWAGAVCGTTAGHIAAAIAHVIEVAGVDHVALGSDFDGGVTTEFDVTGLPLLVPALREEGLTADDIAKVLGGNALRLLLEVLPEG